MVQLQWFENFQLFKIMFLDATTRHQFETVESKMETKDKFEDLSKKNPADSNLISFYPKKLEVSEYTVTLALIWKNRQKNKRKSVRKARFPAITMEDSRIDRSITTTLANCESINCH